MNFVNEAVDIVDSRFNIVAIDEWESIRINRASFLKQLEFYIAVDRRMLAAE